jgi:hypothetical protein
MYLVDTFDYDGKIDEDVSHAADDDRKLEKMFLKTFFYDDSAKILSHSF